MKVQSDSKYQLHDLHEEIDFYDRKILHCQKFETFDKEEDRAAAVAKLASKRETLVKKAVALAEMGVEYDPQNLPRSLKEAAAEKENA